MNEKTVIFAGRHLTAYCVFISLAIFSYTMQFRFDSIIWLAPFMSTLYASDHVSKKFHISPTIVVKTPANLVVIGLALFAFDTILFFLISIQPAYLSSMFLFQLIFILIAVLTSYLYAKIRHKKKPL